MATGSEMIDGFQRVTAVDYGARFYRTDLHFHTPASEDARGPLVTALVIQLFGGRE